MNLGTFVAVFPRISLHMLGGATAFWLVQPGFRSSSASLSLCRDDCVVWCRVLRQDSKIQGVISFPKIPTGLFLSKAIRLGQRQTLRDVNKRDLNGSKFLVGCDIRFS